MTKGPRPASSVHNFRSNNSNATMDNRPLTPEAIAEAQRVMARAAQEQQARQFQQMNELAKGARSMEIGAARSSDVSRLDTVYDEWARNTPWENARNAARASPPAMAPKEYHAQVYDIIVKNYGADSQQMRTFLQREGRAAHAAAAADPQPKKPEEYTKPFCDFLTENPTVFHAVGHFEERLQKEGYEKVSPFLG